MTKIKCPECNKKIIEWVTKCPHCNTELERHVHNEEKHEESSYKELTRNDLSNEQKIVVKKSCLTIRILGIFLPWIALLWARNYGTFVLFPLISLVVGLIWGDPIWDNDIVMSVDLIIRIITFINLPKRAFNKSEGKLKHLAYFTKNK